MLKKRIIPTLLYNNNTLVKGKNFKSDRSVGSAIESIKIYNHREVDELVFFDLVASRSKSQPDYGLILELSKECLVPFTVGGGINKLGTIEKLLKNGADKVVINSEGVANPKFLQSSSEEFGSQCIVLSLDYSKKSNCELIVNSGTKKTNKNIFDYLNSIKDINYGELIVCSVDNDGCLNGYDYETLKKLRKLINVPLICSGGCSGYDDMLTAFNECKVDAVAASSIFHFSHMTPRQAKIYLKSKGVDVRI